MVSLFIFFSLFLSFTSYEAYSKDYAFVNSKDRYVKFSANLGYGVDLGGLGAQAIVNFPQLYSDIFIAYGLRETHINQRYMGGGFGFNYFLHKNHAMTLYHGTLGFERIDQYSESWGSAIGYKYYPNGQAQRGFNLGAFIDEDRAGDASFSVSIAYQF